MESRTPRVQSRVCPAKSSKRSNLSRFFSWSPISPPSIWILRMTTSWWLYFDGSKTKRGSRVRVVIQSWRGTITKLSIRFKEEFTNNQVEYEALIWGLAILKNLGVKFLKIFGDSQLVINQASGDYKCISPTLILYKNRVEQLLKTFDKVTMKCIPRGLNQRANLMAQIASGYKTGLTSPEGIDRIKCLQFGCENSVLGEVLHIDTLTLDNENEK